MPREEERLPVIRAQVEETYQRQKAGLLPADMDAALLRLMGFALVSYPRLLPQITRMVTGMDFDDPRFIVAWEAFLRKSLEHCCNRHRHDAEKVCGASRGSTGAP